MEKVKNTEPITAVIALRNGNFVPVPRISYEFSTVEQATAWVIDYLRSGRHHGVESSDELDGMYVGYVTWDDWKSFYTIYECDVLKGTGMTLYEVLDYKRLKVIGYIKAKNSFEATLEIVAELTKKYVDRKYKHSCCEQYGVIYRDRKRTSSKKLFTVIPACWVR